MDYEIIDVDAFGRIGKIVANDKQIITPNLFPVVHPFKNVILPKDLKKFGVEGIFTNAYIMYNDETKRNEVVQKKVHKFLNYDGLVATDSGAFQQYMYNKDSQLIIDPREIESFQENIGTDFAVILDLPVQLNDPHEAAKSKVYTTIERAEDNIQNRTNKNCHWFGPIHGGTHLDLIKHCANEISKLDFDVFAIGGLVKAFLDYRFDLPIRNLLTVKEIVPPHKPIHMFGLGLPQFFSLAVACGCDLMDSAAYVLYAKEGRYFTLSTGTKNLEELEEFPCFCPICYEYTPKELKTFDEGLQVELLAKHNLYMSFSELRTIRQAIRDGNLWELVELRIRNHPNLVKAAEILKDKAPLIEPHEKRYKRHGRLYSSSESFSRPLIYRYQSKFLDNYRVPENSKYLIILPELDTRAKNSPSIIEWLRSIDNYDISREHIHVIFVSEIYGIVPLELIDTFPVGHFESYNSFLDQNSNSLIQMIKDFFEKNLYHYEKCVLLIPERYLSQFGESVAFPKGGLINKISSVLKSKYDHKVRVFDEINDLLQFLAFSQQNEKE